MSSQKVVWAEGMFLHPQHFQQQDRYFHHVCHELHWQSTPYGWGFSELGLDKNLLRQGKIALYKARGIMPDGTAFSIPQAIPQPPIIEIEDKCRDVILHLAIPLQRAGGQNYSHEEDGRVARYIIKQNPVMDETMTGGEQNIVEIAQPNFQILLDNQDLSGFATLPIARIKEKREDSSILMDDDFIPCCLDITVSERLQRFTTELSSMLHHRAEALASHVSDGNTIRSAEFADYLMLLVINRYSPLILHLCQQSLLHPHDLYRLLLTMAGELSTFSHKSKRPQPFPPYEHDQQQNAFAPLISSLRHSLDIVIERKAFQLPLDLRSHGIRVSQIQDRSMIGSAQFILAVKAEMEIDRINQLMPQVAKASSVEKIASLVRAQLPGIRLIHIQAPPGIPYHAGFTYFELDRSSDHWSELSHSGGFALHVGDGFPGLELQFWAIRE